jgi:protein involved in polysaccharide export with SLBB domain
LLNTFNFMQLSTSFSRLCGAFLILASVASHAQTTAGITGATAVPDAPGALGGLMSQPSQGQAASARMPVAQQPSTQSPGRQLPVLNNKATDALPANQGQQEMVLGRRAPDAAQPSQFQRFVQEATGRLLPVYGSELFDTAQSYSPDIAMPAPAEYLLGAGDEVRVQIWGAVDYSGSHTLDRNGQITLPKVGSFALAGVPLRDLEAVLRSQIGKVFTNFSVNANLGRLRSIQLYVVGQARQPGTYTLSSLSTLVNALFASGGPSGNGSMRNIQLTRAGRIVTTIDLYDFIAKGDKGRDLPLQSGDVIVIPPVGPRVALTGALDQAAIYELKSSATTVGDMLGLIGGVPALARPQKAMLERIAFDKTPPRQVQQIGLDADGLKLSLRDGDVLTLLPISQAIANAVTLQGSVAEPLRYPWFEGMRILDLIPERDALITPDYYKRKNLLVQNSDASKIAGSQVAARVQGLADQINWEYAVIERLDRNQLTTLLLPFNLGKAVLQRDPLHNLPLQAGDVVTIMSQSDLRLPQERISRLVRLEGEVAAPGVYQALPGETLPQLLRRAGGLTSQAYVFGLEFSRESVRVRQQQNRDVLIRRLESQSQSQSRTIASNRSPEGVAQAQVLLQQQQAQLRSQIDRLKVLKSNGRMALELDPQGQSLASLPALPLEDGDAILVPAVPGFVAALGSVNNENVFIYRPGKTVGEIIRSAGLTEDAEPSQAFVLRADGSIVARRDRSRLFGGGFETLAIMPGDTVVVPAQLDRESGYNFTVRALRDWTQILANLGIGAAAIRTLRN